MHQIEGGNSKFLLTLGEQEQGVVNRKKCHPRGVGHKL